MPEPMKKVRRRHRHRHPRPPTDLSTNLIIIGNKRGAEEIVENQVDDTCGGVAQPAVDTMTRNKKRKRVKKHKKRQEKTEEEPKKLVATETKIVAADDSSKKFKSNKRGAEEIDENQVVSNKKQKTVDDTCGGVSQPDVDTMIRKKRDRKPKNKQEKMVVVEKLVKESSCEASSDKEAENRVVASVPVKKKGESSDDSDDWDPPEEFSSKEQSEVPTFVKPDEEPKKPVEAKTEDVIRINLGSPFPPLPGGSKLVFMDNLSPSIQESDVVEFFKDDGKIDWVRFKSVTIGDRYVGYGHVRFHASEAAQKALKRNGEELIGHAVKLLESEERTIFDMLTPSIEHKYLFMGNLSPCVTKKDIINFFVDAGKVVSVHLISAGGHFKGYAHVEFASSTVAHKAIRRYGQMLHGRYVELELATEKTIWYTYTPSSGKPPGFGVERGPGYGPTKDRFRCKCTLPVPGISRRNKDQSRCRSCHRLIESV